MRRRAAIAGLCALAFGGSVEAALGATGQQTIAELNAQRTANGIPAGITEDQTWSTDCARHDHYMALNHLLTHDEIQGHPGYTTGGAWAGLGKHSILSRGAGWTNGNPYETAPLHLDELLAPRLAVTGSADDEGYSCTVTFPGWTRASPSAMTVYTYPGDGGTIYASEVAHEQPFTPGDLVGLTQPLKTGPNLIVLVDAPGQSPLCNAATLSGATLTGPQGQVEVKTVDGTTPTPTGGPLECYLSPGGVIIPVAPLLAGTRYQAHVVVTFAGTQITHDWSFTTQGADPGSNLTANGTRVAFNSSSSASIRITFERPDGERAPTITLEPGRHRRVHLDPGTWEACGEQAATTTYIGYHHCVTIIVTGMPTLELGKGRVSGSDVRFPLSYSRVLRGRVAIETITMLTVHCSGRVCTHIPGTSTTKRVLVSGHALTFPLPGPGTGLRLTLLTSAFQLGDVPWTAARASAVFLDA
jgi:hypothetical protein